MKKTIEIQGRKNLNQDIEINRLKNDLAFHHLLKWIIEWRKSRSFYNPPIELPNWTAIRINDQKGN